MRRPRLLALLAVLIIAPALAVAVDSASWYRALERLDFVTDPPYGSDNEFFTIPGIPPNLMFMLDVSGSMVDLPCDQQMKQGKVANIPGCGTTAAGLTVLNDRFFVNMGYKGYLDPSRNPHLAHDAYRCAGHVEGAWVTTNDEGCFQPDLAYRVVGGVWLPFTVGGVNQTIDMYCDYVANTSALAPAAHAACVTHLQTYGYYNEADQWDWAGCSSGTSCVPSTAAVLTGGTVTMANAINGHIDITVNGGATVVTTMNQDWGTAAQNASGAASLIDGALNNRAFATDSGGGVLTITSYSTGATAATSSVTVLPSSSVDLLLALGMIPTTGVGTATTSGSITSTIGPGSTIAGHLDLSINGAAPIAITISLPGGSGPNGTAASTAINAAMTALPATVATVSGASSKITITSVATGSLATVAILGSSNILSSSTGLNIAAGTSTGATNCPTMCHTQNTYNAGSPPTIKNPAVPVLTGDLLNFYPPKYVALRKVVKDVIADNSVGVRMGITTFNSSSNGASVTNEIGPACSDSGATGSPMNSASYATQATALTASVDGLTRASFSTSTPLGSALFDTFQYFSGAAQMKALAGASHATPVAAAGVQTMCAECQHNFVVVVTDGMPNNDTNMPCVSGSGGIPYPCLTAMDNVATFGFGKDFFPAFVGKQNIITNTIGFGMNVPILAAAATNGGGLYAQADSPGQLKASLTTVMQSMLKNATSFSVAPVNTVETRGSTFAFIPRFRPSQNIRWEGHLYRYKLFNEFAAGCTGADTQPAGGWPVGQPTALQLSRNPNGDGDCDDVYLRDNATSPVGGNFVAEDNDGVFRAYDTSSFASWTLTTTVAVPVWDAGAELQKRNDTVVVAPATAIDPRTIVTVIDKANLGGTTNNGIFEPGEELPFDILHAADLMPYLALGTKAGPFCTTLATKAGVVGGYLTDLACAVDFIKFIRGADVLDENANGNRTEPRPFIMGDVFHSAPILVTPPTQTFFCDLGVINQCVPSLYSPTLTSGGPAAYAAYVTTNATREQIVLVGANDGMVHAFSAGSWVPGDDPDTVPIETNYFNLGAGREKWAFIPPDMLPKLQRLVVGSRHELFVDGTSMVRDIWADTVSPFVKEAAEYHTMAVFGERQGGRHWFALDVTDPNIPKFRWLFPDAGKTSSTDSLAMGETWNDFAPAAPPIVPIALEATGRPVSTPGPVVNGTPAQEVYAVILNGGQDSNMLRGRGIWVLDVYTGDLLWRFSRADASNTPGTDPRYYLGPVPGTVSALDIGNRSITTPVDADGLFDTAVFGDMLGQVWVLNLWKPGKVAAGTEQLVDTTSWFGARVFEEFKGSKLSARTPFFQQASATVLSNGTVRVYLGAGDRRNIIDKKGGVCAPDNLTACMRKECSIDAKIIAGKDHLGSIFYNGEWKYTKNSTSLTTNTFNKDAVGVSANTNDLLEMNYQLDVDCQGPGTPGGLVSPGGIASWPFNVKCDWGSPECPAVAPWPDAVGDDPGVVSMVPSRFYSLRLYDGVTGSGRQKPFNDATAANSYDTARISDANLKDADASPFVPSTILDDGYFVKHSQSGGTDEDTASGSAILAGCVLWNTLAPGATPSSCGASIASSNAYRYHAHFVSGSSACGVITTAQPRATLHASVVPPPSPTPVVAVDSATGQVRYSFISIEPGPGNTAGAQQTIAGQGDVLGTVQWLEVPRATHECRHGTTVGATTSYSCP